MQYLAYEQLTQDQINQMRQMLAKCFHQNIYLTNDYNYLIATRNDNIIAMTAVKYDVSSHSASLWNVCATSLGKIRHTTKGLLEYGIPLILQQENQKIWLVLEFENPYWTRALYLYTSLGFVNIITGSIQFEKIFSDNRTNVTPFLKKGIILFKTYNDPNRETILKARNKADIIRKNRFKENYGGVGLTKEMAQFGRQIVQINKEYAGYLTVDKNFDFQGIGNITGGNPIYESKNFPALSEIFDTNKKSIFHFHTHPVITVYNNNLEFNPPSLNDMEYVFHSCLKGLVRGYIFSTNGIFAYALTKHAQDHLCSSNIKNFITQYQNIINSIIDIDIEKNNIVGSHIEEIEDILIDYFIESVISIEYEGKPVFDIKYWSYNFLEEKENIVDTFFVSKKIGKRLTGITNITSDITFKDFLDKNGIELVQAIQTGEDLSCSKGYISFLLGKQIDNKIQLKNCLPYSYTDLDKLFSAYFKNPNIIDLVSKGNPLKKIFKEADIY